MPNDTPDQLSPKEMQQWALQEIADSAKAHELRTKSAMELATAYALGEVTSQQAHEQLLQHEQRWGEALPGTHAFKGSNDGQILTELDKARAASGASFQGRLRKDDRSPSR